MGSSSAIFVFLPALMKGDASVAFGAWVCVRLSRVAATAARARWPRRRAARARRARSRVQAAAR